MTTATAIPQPLHPSVIPRLDPQYIEFHNKYIQYVTPPHLLPWDPVAMRAPPSYAVGSRKPLEVGKIEEFVLKKEGRRMRAFTPPGTPEEKGWPVLIYFHGGGWALGGLDSELSVITNLCVRAKSVVISVDYRLAPENKFPAPIEDAVEALQWVLTEGKVLLNLDTTRIATGGSSAGGNIAAVLALKSAEDSFMPRLPAPMLLQLLIVPVVDNTATAAPGGRWEPNKEAPFLSPERVKWFKKMYFRTEDDWTNWEASPIFAPEDLIKKAPRAWIAAGEIDVLREEAIAYAEKFRECGVDAECVVYKGGTHVNMVLDVCVPYSNTGVMDSGVKLISDAVEALQEALTSAA